MWDRYDPRRSDDRDRDGSWDRDCGSRGGTSERDRNEEHDPRDVFIRELDLPRGPERELVRARERTYEINGAESRMLATVGAFRVVSESGIHDLRDEAQNARRSVRHLEEEGLIRTTPLSADDRVAVLTERGRELLDENRYQEGGCSRPAPRPGLRPRPHTRPTFRPRGASHGQSFKILSRSRARTPDRTHPKGCPQSSLTN